MGNPGPGAWASVISYPGGQESISGTETRTTNNRMELMAVIAALMKVSEGPSRTLPVEIITDSLYVKKGITEWVEHWIARGWKTASKKPVKNQALWQELKRLVDDRRVTWRWVRGHSGDVLNEECHRLVSVSLKAKKA